MKHPYPLFFGSILLGSIFLVTLFRWVRTNTWKEALSVATWRTAALCLAVLGFSVQGCTTDQSIPRSEGHIVPDTIRVVVASYYPIRQDAARGAVIDTTKTGDWGLSLQFTRNKVDSVTSVVAHSLETGSTFHGYKRPNTNPSLIYDIVERIEFLEPLPTISQPDKLVPMTDYAHIFEQVGGEAWVQKNDIDEFWVWGYHGGVLDLWESNMSSPFGDVSNSDRNTEDLPVLSKTYTIYHYNYQRGAAEAVENHMHQMEAVLNSFDGRDDTQPSEWPGLLFWGKFVGSDSTHTLRDPRRAGWSHYPPNASKDYEWANTEPVLSDIENWNPDAFQNGQSISCSKWDCDHLGWFVYWMQNMPGASNNITYNGNPVRNWWTFLSHYDEARSENWKLWIAD